MKRVFFTVIILILVLIGVSFINEDYSFTGKVTADKFIRYVNHPSDIQSNAVFFSVGTDVKASCSYALSLRNDIGYKYFKLMEVTSRYEHSQLLTGLKDGEYDINIKCANENGFIETSVSGLNINLPSNCVVYCQYKTKCQEVADDSCGNLCRRETDNVICDKNSICKDGICVEKELRLGDILEEQPAVIIKESGLKRFISWFRGLFS